MEYLAAFLFVMIFLFVGEWVSSFSKAYIPSVFVTAILFLIGFWTHLIPADIIAKASFGKEFAGVGVMLLLVHLGTIMNLKELLSQWRPVTIALAGTVGTIVMTMLIGTVIYDWHTVVAAIPPLTGGLVAALLMSDGLKAAGLTTLVALPISIFISHSLIGYPLTSVMLKADNIKLMATGGVSFSGERPIDVQLTEAELRAAVEEAHHKGRTACAHAQGTEGIKNAIRAGVDSVEHAIYLDDEAIGMFLETGTYIVPTLVAPWAINQHTDILPDFMVEKSLAVEKEHVKSIGRAAKAGVKLAMGTDSGTAFNDFEKASAFELELMVNAGATPLQALQSTTGNAADLLHIADRAGRIESGKLADFLVLDKNPLEDIRYLQEEKQVFKKGKKVVG